MQRLQRPREVQRHGPLGVVDQRRVAAGAPRQVLAQRGDVAERGRHQQELRLRQHQQRHLPRPAALRLGVEVELVHHDLADVRVRALAQRDVGQDLRGAADDRRAAVDRRVAGQHAHVLGAEDLAQGEELLRDERLDRRGVERDAAVGQRREVRRDRDHRLPGAGRRGEDHVVAAEELDRRLFLMRIEAQALLLGPADERLVDGVGAGLAGRTSTRLIARPVWRAPANLQPRFPILARFAQARPRSRPGGQVREGRGRSRARVARRGGGALALLRAARSPGAPPSPPCPPS